MKEKIDKSSLKPEQISSKIGLNLFVKIYIRTKNFCYIITKNVSSKIKQEEKKVGS